jgi:crotonobetainyl-CoA:carnitine CoA-transferase CaiB-like acyl-CoA transferase
MAAFVLQEHLAQHSFTPPVGPPGDQRLLNKQNKPVQTADGWISFTVNTDKQVQAFLAAVGRSDLSDDARFGTVASRATHVGDWFAVRGAPLTQRTTAEWLEIFAAADIASKPCHTLETLPRDRHLEAVGLLVPDSHPTEGDTVAIRSTIRFGDAYPPLPGFAQPRGWESRDVLRDLGFAEGEIEQLWTEGAILSDRAA